MLYQNHENENYLHKEDGGDSVAEFFMEGFVAEEVHGEEGGGGATEHGKEEQRGFGDAAGETFVLMSIADGFPFVDTIGEECQQIDREEVI